MREGLDGTASPYSDRDVDLANRAVQDTVMMGRLRDAAATNPAAQERLTLIQTNARASAAFLAEVATRPGVQRTESGVLYAITTPGAGARPGPADQVLVHYVGRFADGVEFDRSPEGQAVIFRVGGVVPGFAEMLLAMQPGESRTVYLPPNQAFGITGSTGPDGESGVPPASALVFDLSLVEVVAPGDAAE
jgi:FKBP-type peptidyl-prolyl cis-trans isomerase